MKIKNSQLEIDHEELHHTTLLHAQLSDENNQIKLSYMYSNNINRTKYFQTKSELNKFLKTQPLVDIWAIKDENSGQVTYWYKNNYDELKTALTLDDLDKGYTDNLPSYYYGYLIKDIGQEGKITACVLKQYNWLWQVNSVKRYASTNFSDFIKDFQSLKQSWEKSKIYMGAGLGTLLLGGVTYWLYRSTAHGFENNTSIHSNIQESSAVSLLNAANSISGVYDGWIDDKYFDINKAFSFSLYRADLRYFQFPFPVWMLKILVDAPEWVNTSVILRRDPFNPSSHNPLDDSDYPVVANLGWNGSPQALKVSGDEILVLLDGSIKQNQTAAQSLLCYQTIDSQSNKIILTPRDSFFYTSKQFQEMARGVDVFLLDVSGKCVESFSFIYDAKNGRHLQQAGKTCLADDTIVVRYKKLAVDEHRSNGFVYILGDNAKIEKCELTMKLFVVSYSSLHGFIKTVGNLTMPNVCTSINTYSPSLTYSKNYLYLASDGVGLLVIDVTKASQPSVVNTYPNLSSEKNCYLWRKSLYKNK